MNVSHEDGVAILLFVEDKLSSIIPVFRDMALKKIPMMIMDYRRFSDMAAEDFVMTNEILMNAFRSIPDWLKSYNVGEVLDFLENSLKNGLLN